MEARVLHTLGEEGFFRVSDVCGGNPGPVAASEFPRGYPASSLEARALAV